MSEAPFSRRHGLSGPREGTVIRDAVPNGLRTRFLDVLRSLKLAGLGGVVLHNLFCQVTDDIPENSIDGSLAFDEAARLIYKCPWFQFYEIVEELSGLFQKDEAVAFAKAMNEAFVRWGIGWQLVNGEVVIRGDEAFEGTLRTAVVALEEDAKPTAAGHLRAAIGALSARPKPNTCGAVAQAINSVECVLGEITGATMTLGEYLKKNSGLFHPALKKGIEGVYGYASDEGARHGKEGTEPALEEAEFAVAVCAAVCTLLTRKHPK